MEVCIFTRIFIYFRVSLTTLTIDTGSKQLVHRCGGNIHHIRAGPQEENQDMGPYDRALRFWGEDPGKIPIPIP